MHLPHFIYWYENSRIARALTAAASGALITLSLAPYNYWLAGILAPLILAVLLEQRTPKQGFNIAWFFGLGMFASGASWVYVAIHDFGYTGVPLAIIMTGLFVSGLALVFALPFYFYCRHFSHWKSARLFVFPAVWVLGEWLRSWLLTGFPWLYLGYAHIDTWLSGWGPILGVFGISYFVVQTGPLIIATLQARRYHIAASHLLALAAIWFGGMTLQKINWTQASQEPLEVALVQPNIDLAMKWDPRSRGYILSVLAEETDKHWDKDIIVWPEAAIPMMYHEASDYLDVLNRRALSTDTTLITGILFDQAEPRKWFNSILAMGTGEGIYFKQRLVPFGEYVPLESWLRGLIHFFDLPNSVIHAGPKNQLGLRHKSTGISPYICYEIVYPDLVASYLNDSELLITISNDAWFGDSIGPKQHLEMAQMRALENGRPIIRATNTGISAVIDHKGHIEKVGRAYTQDSFSTSLTTQTGLTPFSQWRSYPVIAFSLLILLLYLSVKVLQQRKINRNNSLETQQASS